MVSGRGVWLSVVFLIASFIASSCQQVDGGYSEWTPWTPLAPCSDTCGNGTRPHSRIRQCNNPTPSNGGLPCSGEAFQTQNKVCNDFNCPINGAYSPWEVWATLTGCSVTCGGGRQTFTRTRVCDNPAPQFNGLSCQGTSAEVITRSCSIGGCPIDGAYSPWTQWASTGPCSDTCNTGTQPFSRNRVCNDPAPINGGLPCQGPNVDSTFRDCNTNPCPVDGGFGSWGAWDNPACNVTCGGGLLLRTRIRQCNNPLPMFNGANCVGLTSMSETRTCSNNLCPIDGGLSPWTNWTATVACPVTCGGGERTFTRTRVCNNPAPLNGGRPCSDSTFATQTRSCNPENCPIDGGIGPWSAWVETGCQPTCGTGVTDFRYRNRNCSSPIPQFGGMPCAETRFESKILACNNANCPVDGNWAAWTPWSNPTCTKTCGLNVTGPVFRSRQCSNPAPADGGALCPGEGTESSRRLCNVPQCAVDGAPGLWGPWSPRVCTRTCGNNVLAFVFRERNCTNPPPSNGGIFCQQPLYESRYDDCNVTACPVDGNWAAWTPWSNPTCTDTCGVNITGPVTRSRQCSNPAPSNGGTSCLGEGTESSRRLCDVPQCVVNGQMTEWSPWVTGSCSATCGPGTVLRRRTRSCTNPPPQFGGLPCTERGNETDQQSCFIRVCPTDGGFGLWGPWDIPACPVTCGGGQLGARRSRQCNNPTPSFDGRPCQGLYTETDDRTCNTDPCPIDGQFSPWTQWNVPACPGTCGSGISVVANRSRACNNPTPQFGGRSCSGSTTQREGRMCFLPDCPVDGHWSPWSSPVQTGCSRTCGPAAVRYVEKTRRCGQPVPRNGGLICLGSGLDWQNVNCNLAACPEDGSWALWSDWSITPCSTICGNESTSAIRTRTCTNPPPSNGGASCPGQPTQFRTQSCRFHGCSGLQAELKNTSIRVGDTALFRLTVDSGDLGRWYKDGTEIQEEVNRVVIVGAGRERQLIVYDSRVSDGGVYVFQWNNQSTSATLTVGDCLPFSVDDASTGMVFNIGQGRPGFTFYTEEICHIKTLRAIQDGVYVLMVGAPKLDRKTDNQAMGHITCKGDTMTGGRWGCFELNKACDLSDLADSGISINLKILSETNITITNLSQILFNTVTIIRNTELNVKDMAYLALIFEKSARVSNITPANLNELITIMTKVETTSTDRLTRAQLRGNVANRILESLDEVTDKLVFPGAAYTTPDVHSFTSITWNLKHPALTQLPLGLQLRGDNSNPRNQVLMSVFDVPDSQNTVDTDTAIFFTETFIQTLVHGPPDEDVRMTFNVHRNPKLFEVSQNPTPFPSKYVLNSKVISARIVVNGKPVSFLGGEGVTLIFKPEKIIPEEQRDGLTSCGYWDFAGNDNTGKWATDGCVHAMQNGRDVCKFNHLTNFAVLMDFYGQSKLDAAHEMSLSIISIVGLSLSIIGLSITVLSFLAFRKLRQTRSQRTLFNLALAELCSFLVFLAGINQTQSHVGCIVVAALLHYFILASFLWMLAEAVLHYLLFVKVLGTDTPRYMLKVGIPAWCLPLLPIIIVMTINSNLYRGGEKYCWMSLSAFYYGFALPVALIILCNIILYIIIVFNICRRSRMMQAHSSQSDGSRTLLNIRVSILCFILLGISWVFGLLTISDARVVFQYVFCITNSIQGFLIFVLFTARNKHVWNSWLGLCCRKKPGTYVSGDFRTSAMSLRTSAHDKNWTLGHSLNK